MRAVIQRCRSATVQVAGQTVGEIGVGFVVLLGVASDDTSEDAQYLTEKIAGLRVFNDEQGKMNLALADVGGSLLVVSQFTLLADTRKGRRPSFVDAAPPELGEKLYLEFVALLRRTGLTVQTGIFRAEMQVALVNDGPVTLILDSRHR